MAKHVVVGAGPIGTATALLLAEAGNDVVIATRSGGGLEAAGITRVKVDASDAQALTTICDGAVAIYNCVNPDYTKWDTQWPPIATAFNTAAQASGAVLATCSNLYGYGPVTGPITPDLPLAATGKKGKVRVKMWQDSLALHNAGKIGATEARGSDYIGPEAQGMLGDRAVPNLLAGKTISTLGNPDVPHTWTYTVDMARTLIAIAANPAAWGRAWHVPSNPPRTQREAIADLARNAGVETVKVRGLGKPVLTFVGAFSPLMRELKETYYQFDAPFVLDDSVTRSELKLEPTPWNDVLAANVAPFLTTA